MTRSPSGANGKPASALRADAGFTLIEVIVAIVLIGASLLTVVGAASAAFGFQAVARQQQVATTIATKKMEEVRALPWSVISGGMTASALSGDPNVVDLSARPGRPRSAARYALARCGTKSLSATEDIPTGAVPLPTGVLNPYRVSGGATVDRIAYNWSTYITKPTAGDPFHATVCVTWTWKGTTRGTMIQSWIWSPQGPGCIGRPVTAVGGPCVSVSATVPDGAVSIDVWHPYDPNAPSSAPTAQLSYALAGATSQLVLADRTTATAGFTAAKLQGSSVILDERTTVTADDDSSTPIAPSASSGAVALEAIPLVSTAWIEPYAGFRIRYLAGSGQVGASAGSDPCPSVTLVSEKTAVCAVSGVTRPTNSGNWLDTRYAIGDGFFVQPIAVSNAPVNAYQYGTYAQAGAGGVAAQASRDMLTVFRVGGVPASTISGDGGTATFKSLAELLLKDSVSLTSSPPGATSASYARASLNTVTSPMSACSKAPEAISGPSTLTYGCGWQASASAFLGTQTTLLEFTWTWGYTAGSTFDSCVSAPCGAPRTVQATSPSVDVTLYVVRTFCIGGAFGKTNGADDHRICAKNKTDYDRYKFEIALSLGAATVTYDKQL